jgi:hypothetical protein
MEIVLTVGGLIVGALFGLLIARHYYKKSGEELKAVSEDLKGATQEIKKLSLLMLRALAEATGVKFNRDEDGQPKGLAFERNITESVTGEAAVSCQVTKTIAVTANAIPEIGIKVIRKGEEKSD